MNGATLEVKDNMGLINGKDGEEGNGSHTAQYARPGQTFERKINFEETLVTAVGKALFPGSGTAATVIQSRACLCKLRNGGREAILMFTRGRK